MNKENMNSNKCPICGRPTHKTSKYCIFHAPLEEKTEEEFKEALGRYIDKIITASKIFNFEKFIFIGELNFSRDFNVKKIHKNHFNKAEFYNGKVSFSNIVFSKRTVFINCIFGDEINFSGSHFKEALNIYNTNFIGNVSFNEVEFNTLEIKGTTFQGGNNNFQKARFNNDLTIESCNINHSISFNEALFYGNVKMGGKDFNHTIFNFDGADINYNFELFFNSKELIQIYLTKITINPNFTKIIISTNNSGIYFNNAILEKTRMIFELYNNSFLDFHLANLKDTNLKYEQIKKFIVQEQRKNYEQAGEVYLTLKNNFHRIGRYDDESECYKKEMDMKRASNWIYNMKYNKHNLKEWILSGHFWKWLSSAFYNVLYGYGERPWNVVLSALIIILGFALFFNNIGIGNPEIIEIKELIINDKNVPSILNLSIKGILKNNIIRNFTDSLYFSLITFTTLGYGDLRPLEGIGRILAGSEAFIGAFMMALFVYTFARRTGGR